MEFLGTLSFGGGVRWQWAGKFRAIPACPRSTPCTRRRRRLTPLCQCPTLHPQLRRNPSTRKDPQQPIRAKLLSHRAHHARAMATATISIVRGTSDVTPFFRSTSHESRLAASLGRAHTSCSVGAYSFSYSVGDSTSSDDWCR